jgi:hypothetical protein
MTPRHRLGYSGFGLLLSAALATSFAAAAPADSSPSRARESGDPSAKRYKVALNDALQRHLDEANLDKELAGYSLSPSLIQLRRYVEPNAGHVKLVCVVGITLKSESTLVAEVRGNAATFGASPTDTIDAAMGSAVSHLPGALAQLRGKPASAVAAR